MRSVTVPAFRSSVALTIVVSLPLALQGCGIIPKDGPTGFEVRGQAEVTLEDAGRLSYAFVKLSPLVLSTIQTDLQAVPLFSQLARLAPSADVRVGPADTISVSIFEAGAGGLFIPPDAGARPGNFVQIPPQEIDRNGNISIPYAGTIRALGRSPREIETDIVERIKSKAIEPQAMVTIGERSSNTVSVLGDVNQPTAIPLRPGGIRLLTALARAGGSKVPAHSSIVTLQRRGRTEQALLSAVLKSPAHNIQLFPEDVLYVSYEPRYFLAFGSVGGGGNAITVGVSSSGNPTNGRRFVIDQDNMTLAEGLGTAGGLLSDRADARSIFLFRYMPRQALIRAGVDLTNLVGEQVPTVFTVDLSNAEGYFLANHLYMKAKDIIYVSESPSVDLIKFLNIVNAVNFTTRDIIGTVSDAKGL
jgi:polysaccharide export outer membrane protein